MQFASKRNRLKVVSRRLVLLGSLLGCTAVMSGCGTSSVPVVNNNLALVKGFNAYIPATGVDGTLTVTSGSVSLGALAFGGLGGNISVTAGSFTATATGTGITTPLALAAPATLTGNNSPYVVAAAGQSGQTGTFAPQLFMVTNYAPSQFTIPVGQNAVRVINLSLNPNPVSLYKTVGGVPSAAVATALDNLAFGYSTTANQYALVNTVQLQNFAVVDTTAPTTALTLDPGSNLNTQVLQTAQAYTLYIYGQAGNASQPLTAKWVLDYSVVF